LFQDEREEYEEEDANGEDLFRDDMLRFFKVLITLLNN